MVYFLGIMVFYPLLIHLALRFLLPEDFSHRTYCKEQRYFSVPDSRTLLHQLSIVCISWDKPSVRNISHHFLVLHQNGVRSGPVLFFRPAYLDSGQSIIISRTDRETSIAFFSHSFIHPDQPISLQPDWRGRIRKIVKIQNITSPPSFYWLFCQKLILDRPSFFYHVTFPFPVLIFPAGFTSQNVSMNIVFVHDFRSAINRRRVSAVVDYLRLAFLV